MSSNEVPAIGQEILFVEHFKNPRHIWRKFRTYKGETEGCSPVKIVHNAEEVTSPKKLSNIFNEHFVNKQDTIRNRFENNDRITLEIDFVTVNEVYEAVHGLKTSNSCGFNQLSLQKIKLIPRITSLWITHLIKMMMLKGKFLDVLKITMKQ